MLPSLHAATIIASQNERFCVAVNCSAHVGTFSDRKINQNIRVNGVHAIRRASDAARRPSMDVVANFP